MRPSDFERKLIAIVKPAVESLGLTFWGLTAPPAGAKRIVQIFVDAAADSVEKGVNIDQCAEVSKHVGVIFDVEEIFRGAFTLDVSSPGLERKFFELEQMTPYINKVVHASLNQAIEGLRKHKGTLLRIEKDTFVIQSGDEEVSIHWMDVKKVRLVHEF